jgi:hypothetical protein
MFWKVRGKPVRGLGKKHTLDSRFWSHSAARSFSLGWCYPSAVFLWGDEVERYNGVLQTRRIIWGVIITLIVGALSTFLYTGLVSGP